MTFRFDPLGLADKAHADSMPMPDDRTETDREREQLDDRDDAFAAEWRARWEDTER